MSYQGTKDTERFVESRSWPDTYLVHETEETIIIKDGKVTIVIPYLQLVVVAKVKGTKGQGVADADNLTEPTPTHVEILQALKKMMNSPHPQTFTIDYLMDVIDGERARKKGLFVTALSQEDKINRNSFRRPISELLRKGAFLPVYGTNKLYATDSLKVDQFLEMKKF